MFPWGWPAIMIDNSAKPVTAEKDPVCGMTVDTAKSKFHINHAGHEIHFCSAHCQEKFIGDPARYIQMQPDKATVTATAAKGTRYTCPMHPEIIRDAPGNCPICGMALEPVLPSEDDENPELDDFSKRFWWTLPLSLVVLALAMLGHRLAMFDAGKRTMIEFVLSTPVVLWAAWPFFVRCAQSLRTR